MPLVSFESLQSKQESVAVVGLGYVGLPLAVALAKHFNVVGFDISERRITELRAGHDRTNEVANHLLALANISYTTDPLELKKTKFIIVAVPTPIDDQNNPDLTLVEKATEVVGAHLSAGSIVVYESTVYPGVTEDICVPILATQSGLQPHVDFKVGYSPERINPGDREHTIDKVVKVVAGEDNASLAVIAGVYGSITTVFQAASIKVAEAAKVIENTQRDLNIALMNELALIFNKMDISIHDVLKAAGTKWNFLKFYPGLVGGHCIGVDPYYLTHRAQQLGHDPEVILAGRRINDHMAAWVAEQTIQQLKKNNVALAQAKILVCGITFKENVPDVRNSKVAQLVDKFQKSGLVVDVIDPIADTGDVEHEYGIALQDVTDGPYDAVVLAVAHNNYANTSVAEWKKLLVAGGLFVDIKGVVSRNEIVKAGLTYWGL